MGNAQLTYTADELLATDVGLEPLIVSGVRCHGGFRDDGTYVSPRTRFRTPAITAWQDELVAAGAELIDIPIDTWRPNYPNVAQSKFLLRKGVRDPFIAALTRIGTVEGFGAMLRYAMVDDLARFVADDVAGTAYAHLNDGLVEAHARDEAGFGDEAGHDRMWFAARDVAFETPITADVTALMLQRMGIVPDGGNAAPDAAEIARRVAQLRQFDELDPGFEMMLQRMIQLLYIEIQAFHTFNWAQEVLGDPDVCAGDGYAAEIVSYIRADETPHVDYVRTMLSELAARDLTTTAGRTIPGADVVSRLMAHGLDVSFGGRRAENLRIVRAEFERAIGELADADDVLAEFDALGTIRPDADGVLIYADTGEPA